MTHGRIAFSVLALSLLGCGGGPAMTDGGNLDGGTPLTPSTLFGPCQEDWQCPGDGAICRSERGAGWSGGFCTVPCEDRTPCDAFGVYHHCLVRQGETQAYCERRCLNGFDCGRETYTCEGNYPPIDSSGRGTGACFPVCAVDDDCGAGTHCNPYSGLCTTDPLPTSSETGGICTSNAGCRSGTCVPEVDASGTPTGWVGGYCRANCILPTGYNPNDFFAGDMLPKGTCAGDAVCLPATANEAHQDLGTCYDQCATPSDCRLGYTCLKTFRTSSGTVGYPNGICIPIDCSTATCPSGYTCVTVTAADGTTQNVCGPN